MRDVDTLIRNARVLDVFTGSLRAGDVAIADGRIVGFGADGARDVVEADGRVLMPGLVDAHIHIESTQLSPAALAGAVLPHGTTTLIADPHEIANVWGIEGIRYLIEATRDVPLRVFFMAPSCVPASPFEASGATLDAAAIRELLTWERVLGLGEVMNYPGVLAGDSDLLAKLSAAAGRPIDGHAPGLRGPDLWTYVRRGPRTDHECTTIDEAREKMAAGMHILIREGTSARNLDALCGLLTPQSAPFVHFCTDDRHPETLLAEGHIDRLVSRAIGAGVAPETAVAAATIHAARLYGLHDLGAVAPGYRADLLLVSDLDRMTVDETWVDGTRVASRGTCLVDLSRRSTPTPRPSMNVRLTDDPFFVAAPPVEDITARILVVQSDQVVTDLESDRPTVEDGRIVADPSRDLLKLVVVERHHGTGRVGVGLVRGFGLTAGALASSVAHDSHNLVAVGTSDAELRHAIETLVTLGGGQAVVASGRILAELPLPIAGLMSDRSVEGMAEGNRSLVDAAQQLSCQLPSPFMTLSFLALTVIPRIRLTDRGLFDVDRFELVPLLVEG